MSERLYTSADATLVRETLAACCGDEVFSPHNWLVQHDRHTSVSAALAALAALDRLVAENAELREALSKQSRPDLSCVPPRT